MGLVSWTLGLPLLPVRGVIALAEVIQRQVELEQRSAQSMRRRLEEVARQRERDPEHFTAEQEARAMREITAPARARPEKPDETGRDETGRGER